MKVVLFATALLAYAGMAMKLEPAATNHHTKSNSPLDELMLAQVSQTPGLGSNSAEADQLIARATTAMEKDDKKKMGEKPFRQIKEVEKTFEGKNKDKKEKLAKALDNIIAGKDADGGSKKKPDEKKKEEPKKDEPEQKHEEKADSDDEAAPAAPTKSSGGTDDIKEAMANIKGKFLKPEDQKKAAALVEEATRILTAKHKNEKEEQKVKLTQVIEKLQLKMQDMQNKYREKNDIDVKRAQKEYQLKLKHVNEKILKTMMKQTPGNFRSVILNMVTAFRDGKISKGELSQLVYKDFQDKLFENIFKCNQGDLEACNKINLKTWRSNAEHEISIKAKKAQLEMQKVERQKKDQAITQIQKIIEQKSQNASKAQQALQKVHSRAQDLIQQVIKNPEFTPQVKADIIVQIEEQSKKLVADLNKNVALNKAEVIKQIDSASASVDVVGGGEDLVVAASGNAKVIADQDIEQKQLPPLQTSQVSIDVLTQTQSSTDPVKKPEVKPEVSKTGEAQTTAKKEVKAASSEAAKEKTTDKKATDKKAVTDKADKPKLTGSSKDKAAAKQETKDETKPKDSKTASDKTSEEPEKSVEEQLKEAIAKQKEEFEAIHKRALTDLQKEETRRADYENRQVADLKDQVAKEEKRIQEMRLKMKQDILANEQKLKSIQETHEKELKQIEIKRAEAVQMAALATEERMTALGLSKDAQEAKWTTAIKQIGSLRNELGDLRASQHKNPQVILLEQPVLTATAEDVEAERVLRKVKELGLTKHQILIEEAQRSVQKAKDKITENKKDMEQAKKDHENFKNEMVEAKKQAELDNLSDKLEQEEDDEPIEVKKPDIAKIIQTTQKKENQKNAAVKQLATSMKKQEEADQKVETKKVQPKKVKVSTEQEVVEVQEDDQIEIAEEQELVDVKDEDKEPEIMVEKTGGSDSNSGVLHDKVGEMLNNALGKKSMNNEVVVNTAAEVDGEDSSEKSQYFDKLAQTWFKEAFNQFGGKK